MSIKVESELTADNTDFLAGSQLDQPGQGGLYRIFGASTVGDTLVSVSLGGATLVDAQALPLRANAEIREDEDGAWADIISQQSGRPVIAVDEQTAATIRIRVLFFSAAELAAA